MHRQGNAFTQSSGSEPFARRTFIAASCCSSSASFFSRSPISSSRGLGWSSPTLGAGPIIPTRIVTRETKPGTQRWRITVQTPSGDASSAGLLVYAVLRSLPGSLINVKLFRRAGIDNLAVRSVPSGCRHAASGSFLETVLPMNFTLPAAAKLRRAYAMMLGAQFFFATMSVCGRAAGERSDWRIAALARAWLVFAFAYVVAKIAGAQLTWRGTPTLWVRSI